MYDERECFKGTVVDDGEAVLKVSHVGEKTYFGSVYLENLKNKEEERESPLQVKLSNLADGIAKFGYIGAASITVSFLFKQFVIDNGYNWEAITNYLSIDVRFLINNISEHCNTTSRCSHFDYFGSYCNCRCSSRRLANDDCNRTVSEYEKTSFHQRTCFCSLTYS